MQNNTAFYNFNFEFHGERVTYDSNMNECIANGGIVCDPNAVSASNPIVNIRPVYNFPYPSQNDFFWTNANCSQMVKVREDGMMCVTRWRSFRIYCLFLTFFFATPHFFFQSVDSQAFVSHFFIIYFVHFLCMISLSSLIQPRLCVAVANVGRILFFSIAREFLPRFSTH